jgi:hypothetical protein
MSYMHEEEETTTTNNNPVPHPKREKERCCHFDKQE